MNREKAFEALSGLDDRYIAEAIRYAPEAASGSSERIVHMKKKRFLTFALAAVLLLALGVTAYAVFFSMSTRIPEPEEGFRIHWEDNPGGYIEWTDVKLAVTFPETAESREIEFRPGWLPEAMASLKTEAFLSRFTAESLAYQGEYEDMYQPLMIQQYAMSMFNQGGALLLLYHTPGQITEEHWDGQNLDVMYFHGTQHFDANPDFNMPERTLEQNFVVLSDAEAGWVISLSGQLDLEQMLEVARHLEVRETGEIKTFDDFENHYTFFDGGVG